MKLGFAQCLLLVAVACSSGGSSGTSTTGGGTSGLPPGYMGNFDAGTCTPAPGYLGNSKHVGAFCSQGGGQCAQWGEFCSIDVDPAQGDYWCLLQCTTGADCGEEACCHVDTQTAGSGLMACVPICCVADAGACF